MRSNGCKLFVLLSFLCSKEKFLLHENIIWVFLWLLAVICNSSCQNWLNIWGRKIVPHRQYVNLASWKHLTSREVSTARMTNKNINSTFSWLWAFIGYLTYQGWSAGGEEQLCQTHIELSCPYICICVWMYVCVYIYIYIVAKTREFCEVLNIVNVELKQLKLHLLQLRLYI